MDILSATPPAADHRIHYGAGEFQFGDLWLPKVQAGKAAPLVVFLHGGWWLSQFDLNHAGFLCKALRERGYAVWSIEYRRVGNGGGWPATFQDVAAGMDHVAVLAKTYPVDAARVIAMGHSAGGHLAFWLAGRQHIHADSAIYSVPGVQVRGVIALAGVVDLRLAIDLSGWLEFAHCKEYIANFMGGMPEEFRSRYEAGSPGDLLPLNVPQILLQGTEDDQIPPQLPSRYAERARKVGDTVTVHALNGVSHLDMVDPESWAFAAVKAAVKQLLG